MQVANDDEEDFHNEVAELRRQQKAHQISKGDDDEIRIVLEQNGYINAVNKECLSISMTTIHFQPTRARVLDLSGPGYAAGHLRPIDSPRRIGRAVGNRAGRPGAGLQRGLPAAGGLCRGRVPAQEPEAARFAHQKRCCHG